jgi:two-component system sensor histidine kinase ChiS
VPYNLSFVRGALPKLRRFQRVLLGWIILPLLLLNGCRSAVTSVSTAAARTPTAATHLNSAGQASAPTSADFSTAENGQSLRFEHLSVGDGLSQDTVICILQDHKGFMWFGTGDGLNRYDGYDFTVYRHDPLDPTSLSSSEIATMYEDRQGTLWVGTAAGLDRFDPDRGEFIHYPNLPTYDSSFGQSSVSVIFEGREGALWIGTHGGGLNQLDRQTGQFTSYRHDPSDPNSIMDDTWIDGIYEDSSGMLWIGGNGRGLDRFDRSTGRFTHFRHHPVYEDTLSSDILVTEILEDHYGSLWVATYDGLNRFEPEEERFIRYQHDPHDLDSLSGNFTTSMIEDRQGTLWIGTAGAGLNRFDQASGRFVHYLNDPADPHSLSNNIVWSLYEDRSGVLWIGTAGGGVNKVSPSGERFAHFRANPTDPNSLSNNVVLSIYEDRQGMLWIGTLGGGLNRLDRTSGQWSRYRHEPGEYYSLSDDSIRSIYEDSEGVLWIGHFFGGGLAAFDRATGRSDHYRHRQYDPTSLSDNDVRVIYEDREGKLWIGTDGGGLNRLDRDTRHFERYLHAAEDPNSLSSNWVSAILEDHEGNFWVGTEGGLNRLERSTGTFVRYLHDPGRSDTLSNDWVTSIWEDGDGTLWVGTADGLNRFDRATEAFHGYTMHDGLPSNTVAGILEDDQGNLWLSTSSGLSRFDPRAESFRNYDVGDGLQSNSFVDGAQYKSSSSEMFFGGTNGFNAFYPEQVQDNPYAPPVVLTALTREGEEIAPGWAIESLTEVTLRRPESSFEFEYAALNYIRPEKNQYAYMLEGSDPEWKQVGTRRFGQYANLPAGRYILRIKGSNNDGVWNETGVSFVITVVPQMWETWWFRGMVALVLVGSVFASYRLRVRSIEARSRELETLVEERTAELQRTNVRLEQEMAERQRAEEALAHKAAEAAVIAERNRLARELHDSVTQSLYSSTLLAEAAQRLSGAGDVERTRGYLSRLGDITQGALKEMRLLVHELRPLALQKEGLVGALQQRLDAVERRAGVDARLVVEGELELSPDAEENLYRIAQEALNNALKHATATLVTVTIRASDEWVELEVADNGSGFDPMAVSDEGGMGLTTMRERARRLGARLEVVSAPGEGTKVRVHLGGSGQLMGTHRNS